MDEIESILENYRKDTGSVGKHLLAMAKFNPDMLKAFIQLRSALLERGVLPRKVKELILLGIFTALRSETAINIHAKGAVRAGATENEIFEAISLALIASGTPSFIAGLSALEQ